jgi:murein DD-endopeptidase MepM/ murein hydrolase activator NlpD
VVVTSSWGDRQHPIHGDVRFHAGVDLAGELAQPVRAAAAGTVVYSGWNGGHGKHVELQHDAHLSTGYSHLLSLLVSVGQVVKRGQVIALVGETGVATGPHLHFEVRRDGESLDPEATLPRPSAATAASVWR